MELMSFGKSKGGTYRGQNGNDDLAMTCINLSPFFDSSQYWDMATLTYEATSNEYRTELEEKIFNMFRSGNSKPLYDYATLHDVNAPSNGADRDHGARQHVFDLEGLDKMQKIKNKFFKD
jgi:hypothetical protein